MEDLKLMKYLDNAMLKTLICQISIKRLNQLYFQITIMTNQL
jgi:hypothetical protein